jgi:glycosyltransferase involved in cell wall biosynthesis
MSDKLMTVGIPAFNAEAHIIDALASILIQTFKDKIEVVIAADNPNNDYSFVLDRFPELDIKILSCDKNTGPGLARQRALDAATTNWITFIDADDVFINPVSLEKLYQGIFLTKNCIEVQGPFFQEINEPNPDNMRMLPRNDVGHPWVFGRLYNTKFLKENNIKFSELRAMEDGEFNWKIRMTVENTPLMINVIEDPIYFWRTGSEHSITRIGIKENDNEPLYNWDLCQVGATAASINAIKFCKKKNPFNGSVVRFTVEMMIGQYFTYVQCLEKKPLFAEQNLFNAKRFYHSCYNSIEKDIDDEILKTMYTAQFAQHSQDMIGIIPNITFFDFMKLIKESDYNGQDEFNEIRSQLPQWVTDLDLKSGVLGEEGYIKTDDEE